MNDMLLGISPEYIYLHEKEPKNLSDLHKPYFLVFCPKERNIETARNEIIKKWKENTSTEDIFSKIENIGEIEKYHSFWDFGSNKKVFKIYTKKSYFVPEVSNYLFFNYNLYTAEHDIPYQQRALVDLATENKFWLFDTNSKKKTLKVLVYDIETTEYEKGNENIPIDIIGYADFDIAFESFKNLENEEFSFDILDCSADWKNMDIKQVVSRNIDEEVDNLAKFCNTILKYDIVSGHNIIGFDNFQIYNRINWVQKSCQQQLSSEEKKIFQNFIGKYSRTDKSFYFGIHSEAVQFYPCSFDTYLGVRKFYSFLDDYSLKSVAPFLGIDIKDRIYLTPGQIKIDEKTLKYNKQDVQEQIGVTLNLIQQALPLSFTTCMPFDMLLSSGAVNMWDHMSLIRGAMHKKIMPPICRVLSISQTLLKDFKGCNTKEDIIKMAKDKKEQLSKDFVRVIKYGDEMPDWMQYPYVIYNINAKDADDRLNYHMPGGMTIKPDKEAFSHFIPWFYVIVADVGAMYPTILKALNVGADTVRLAKKNEQADDWVWLKKISKEFLKTKDVKYREITKEDSFADKGVMLGVKIDKTPGVVNCAMTGIMHMIAKTKEELKKAKKTGNKDEIERLKMMYQSVKGARNAGSVDYSQRIILVNPDGKYENIKIGEFVDRAINKFGYFTEKINGTEFEIANIKEKWKAISINKYGEVEIKKVKQAVRHKWIEKLVKISTKSGFTVVTPNHSVFTIKNGKIIEISAEQIKEDTLLVHAKKIPNIEKNDLKYFNRYKDERQYFEDCYAIPPKNIEFVKPTSDYVYDISVEDNENFIDANGGILLHNTHGILAAPTVSGRQFNLWGAAEITTKGQAILADTLNYLKNKNSRVVYGDSVDSETDIIIKESDLIKIINIKDLFEKHNSSIYKRENHEYKKLKNIECLSINNNNGICEWKKANFIKRHPYKNDIVKVKTQRGMISITKNHSLYTISKDIKEISCKQLNCKDTNIVHISKFNEKGKKIIINALNPLVEFNNELNIVFNIPLNNSTKYLLKYHRHRNNYKGKSTFYGKYIRIKIDDAINLYKKGLIKYKYLKNCYISNSSGKGKIPVIYKLNEDFAKILGAYAAEGSIYIRKRREGTTNEGAHIFVCGHNVKNLKRLKSSLIKIFRKKFKITSAGFDKNGENFRIQGNSSTAYIFKYVFDCGQGCTKKKISPYILSSTKNIQKAFIDEYAKGDGYYETKYRIKPLLGIQTKSLKLVEGLSLLGLNIKLGYPSIRYRKEKSAYHLRFVQYNLNSIDYKGITGLLPQKIDFIKPHNGYVYDISVEKNNNFICANGLIPAHNTDGIYLGCSKSVRNVLEFSKSLGVKTDQDEKNWITKPEVALSAIEDCDKKWQEDLNYPDFELEPEIHDCMIFVKHKNYLIFDAKDGKIEMITKGNNFKGSDKADIARKALNDIMMEVLKENHTWQDEEEARKSVRNSIANKTKEIVSKIDLTKVDLDDLTLIQSVQPAKRYKPIQNGSSSVFGKRSTALENLLGQSIKSRIKLKFVVTKKPLPGITNPSKSGVKPIDYMYPVDFLKSKDEIDLEWYKKMIENYIQGAFGLSDVVATEQTGLDSWM